MPRTRDTNRTRNSSSAEASTVGAATTTTGSDDDNSRTVTLFIVIMSLLFVAVFGGALVGGIVNGDPINGFFITIIAASGTAISVALFFLIRYYWKSRRASSSNDQNFSKEVKGTFSNSDEENLQDGGYYDSGRSRYHNSRNSRTPVEARIKEVQARSVAGEMSALSPHSYDVESLSTRRDIFGGNKNVSRRGLFDFASVASNKQEQRLQPREDPPEGAGPATYHAAWIIRGQSQDPEAHHVTADGQIVSFDDEEEGDNDDDDDLDVPLNSFSKDDSIPSPRSNRSRYDVAGEESELENIAEGNEEASTAMVENESVSEPENEASDVENPTSESEVSETKSARRTVKSRRSRSRSRSRSKSPRKRLSKSKEKILKQQRPPSSTKSALVKSSMSQSKDLKTFNRPTSTKSEVVTSTSKSNRSGAVSVPTTPAASEAGSIASSFFKPFNGLFGRKNKYSVSEAGQSDASSAFVKSEISEANIERESASKQRLSESKSTVSVGTKSEGKPPKMPERRGVDTVRRQSGDASEARYTPSTPGKNSVYSIPPPRIIPSTPGDASAVFSEFQSYAGSSAYSAGVASSTFDPQFHQKALQKMQKIQAHLGANPVDDSMPIYYEEDDKESSIAPSSAVQTGTAYDVFAPPGAIGIVVDTTGKGCIVHSLKKSSPMQGLMNAGDVIIALDDFDVRKMNAASLTKLMAKKSQQKERKFTLIPAEYL